MKRIIFYTLALFLFSASPLYAQLLQIPVHADINGVSTQVASVNVTSYKAARITKGSGVFAGAEIKASIAGMQGSGSEPCCLQFWNFVIEDSWFNDVAKQGAVCSSIAMPFVDPPAGGFIGELTDNNPRYLQTGQTDFVDASGILPSRPSGRRVFETVVGFEKVEGGKRTFVMVAAFQWGFEWDQTNQTSTIIPLSQVQPGASTSLTAAPNNSCFSNWSVSTNIPVDPCISIQSPSQSAPADAGPFTAPSAFDVELVVGPAYSPAGLFQENVHVSESGFIPSVHGLPATVLSSSLGAASTRFTIEPPSAAEGIPASGLYDLTVEATTSGYTYGTSAEKAVDYKDVNALAYVLDRSSSMEGIPLAVAKLAANFGITWMDEGNEVTVASFNESARTDFPISPITGDAVRNSARAAVNGLVANGFTSIGSGMLAACEQLIQAKASSRDMLVLSDGIQNRAPSPDEARMSACFQQLNSGSPASTAKQSSAQLASAEQATRIHTIAFGENADQVELSELSNQTGGLFLFVPTTNDPLALADLFLTIQGEINGEQRFAAVDSSINSGMVHLHPFDVSPVDEQHKVTLAWSDPSQDLDLVLEKPDGTEITQANWTADSSVARVEGPGIIYYTLEHPEEGQWRSKATSHTGSGATDYALLFSGQSQVRMTVAFDQTEYAPSSPIHVSAYLTEAGLPITGANVNADVLQPRAVFSAAKTSNGRAYTHGAGPKIEVSGVSTLLRSGSDYVDASGAVRFASTGLPLFDDGMHGDGGANDGVYGNYFLDTAVEGAYTFNVSAVGSTVSSGSFTRESSKAAVVSASAITRYLLDVQSSRPDSNLTITVSPADVNGATDGRTDFSRLFEAGALVTLVAPAKASNGFVFDGWTVDDTLSVNTPTLSVEMSGPRSVSARYAPALSHSFLLLAGDDLQIEGVQALSGNLHANDLLFVNTGLPSVYEGNLSSVGGIRVEDDNRITGDVKSGQALRIRESVIVEGVALARADVLPVPLPSSVPFRTGGVPVKVQPAEAHTLLPGHYGHVYIGHNATLDLSKGTYFFKTLHLASGASIRVSIADSATAVHVYQDVTMDNRNSISIEGLHPVGGSGSRFFMLSSLRGDITFGAESSIVGSIEAFAGQVRLGSHSILHGSIAAEDISVSANSLLLHHASQKTNIAPPNRFASVAVGGLASSSEGMLSVLGNYPNPFNPTTTIRFQLAGRSPVRLAVYDVLGREVALLIDQQLNAGEHQAVFDASHLSNGIYLYRLVAGQESLVGRMLLLK